MNQSDSSPAKSPTEPGHPASTSPGLPVDRSRILHNKRIAILALGGYEADEQRLLRAQDYFQRHGAQTLITPGYALRHQRFAASDAARLEAIHQVTVDATLNIVIAMRGGYGLTRLLPHIDFAAVARAVAAGKRFVGHSDFTAFHLALLRLTGAISFAGPMAGYDFGVDPAQESISAFTEDHFWTMLEQGRDVVHFPCTGPDLNASGVLWGGNLAMLCSLIGTPWLPTIHDGLLFIEDVNEHPYRIERMILQLQHAGLLQHQRALILGDFSGYRLSAYDNGYDFDTMLAYLRSVIPVPIISGLPFGHCRDKLTLPVGGKAKLQVHAGECALEMHA